jgi:uncharacterized protein (TIGR02646 family)
MKFIDKTTQTSQVSANKLHHWRDNFRSEQNLSFRQICDIEGMTTDFVWNLLKNYIGTDYSESELREALWTEQHGICCYCGCELISLKTVIEHFLAKEYDKYARTFTYQNLFMSCDGNAHSKKHTIQKGETWESIATKYDMSVTELKNKNALQVFRLKSNLTIIPPPRHCDAAKLSIKTPIINPTVLPDCWDRFPYKSDGSIDENKADALTKATIKVLNLNTESLKKKRKAAWKDAKNAYDKDVEIGNCYDNDDYKGILKRTRELLELELNQTYHLCVIHRAYLQKELS